MSATAESMSKIRLDAVTRVAATETNWSLYWASMGIAWLTIIAYSITMWFVSGQASPTIAVDAEPWRVALFHGLEWAMLAITLLVLWALVARPWIKTGHLSSTAIIILSFGTLWYQDPLLNYIVPYGMYSSIFSNLGSWSSFFPGAVAPNIHLVPEPPFQAGLYLTAMPGIVFAVVWAMRQWKSWFADASVGTLFGVAVVFGTFWDLVLELPAVYLQIWAYPGAIRGMTWWPGMAYQFPWYEAPMLGFMFASMASLLMFKNARGQMVCERGSERIAGGETRRNWVRVLALIGILQTLYLLTYNIPTWLVSLHSSAWPENFPKHLVNDICGPSTEVICPGHGVPFALPRRP